MNITFVIPADKVDEVREAIAAVRPIPMIPDPNADPNTLVKPKVPKYTEIEWIKILMKQSILDILKIYKRQEAVKNITVDDNIIT